MPDLERPLSTLPRGYGCTADGTPVIAEWHCPVCEAPTPRLARPGRPRVYCTNACRQKAYRFRREHGIRLLHGDGQPCERAAGRAVTHLLRPPRDPVGHRRNSMRRAVSLCGAFVRPAADVPSLKPEFFYDDVHSCYSCLSLAGAGQPDVPMLHPWQHFVREHLGPPAEAIQVRPGLAALIRRGRRRAA